MKAETFHRCGQILWWASAVTLVATFAAALAIVAARTRHGADPYFDLADLFLVPSVAAGYLALACGLGGLTHYPDHRPVSVRFSILAGLSAFATVVYLVAWMRLTNLP